MEKNSNTIENINIKIKPNQSAKLQQMQDKCKTMQQNLQKVQAFWSEYKEENSKESELRNCADAKFKEVEKLTSELNNLESDIKNKTKLLEIKKNEEATFSNKMLEMSKNLENKTKFLLQKFGFQMYLKEQSNIGWQIKIVRDNKQIILNVDEQQNFELIEIIPRPPKYKEIAEVFRRTGDLCGFLYVCFKYFDEKTNTSIKLSIKQCK